MGALYIIEFPNGKAYVGITAGTTKARVADHRYDARTGRSDYVLHRALRKHGCDAVVSRTLVVADDWGYLLALERRAIATFGTFGRGGYNMTAGGEGALGYKHTPEALKAMGAIHLGKAHHSMPHSAETRAMMSARRTGKKLNLTPEQRAVRKLKMTGNKFAAGRIHSAEERAKRAVSVMRAGAGVCWDRQTAKWRAHISIGGKMKCLGRFVREADAIAVRAAAVSDHLAGAA